MTIARTPKMLLRLVCVIPLLISALSGCGSAGSTPGGVVSQAGSTAGLPPSGGDASIGDDYRISPEDVLEISVWKEPDLQRKVVVRPDGGVSFPLIGNINAAGNTAAQLKAEITAGIAEYIPDAVVTVSVIEVKGLKIFVTGQVKKPGQYLVGRYVDVLQALTLAGGITPFADRRNIRILRRQGNSEEVFHFNYRTVQDGRGLDQNIVLVAGDTVIVP